jgi:hypothetical protein
VAASSVHAMTITMASRRLSMASRRRSRRRRERVAQERAAQDDRQFFTSGPA